MIKLLDCHIDGACPARTLLIMSWKVFHLLVSLSVCCTDGCDSRLCWPMSKYAVLDSLSQQGLCVQGICDCLTCSVIRSLVWAACSDPNTLSHKGGHWVARGPPACSLRAATGYSPNHIILLQGYSPRAATGSPRAVTDSSISSSSLVCPTSSSIRFSRLTITSCSRSSIYLLMKPILTTCLTPVTLFSQCPAELDPTTCCRCPPTASCHQ